MDFRPGIYDGLPMDEYHRMAALSSSGIKKLLRSPAHYLVERTQSRAPTESMRIGTAVHTLLLEPDRAGEIVVMPEFNRRTKDGKAEAEAWLARNADRQAFDAETFERIHRAAEAARAHPAASELLSDGIAERSILWRDAKTGAQCRARYDWHRSDGGIVDVKTAQDASPEGFRRAIGAFQYHVSAAWYFLGAEHVLNATPAFWAFVVVETEPPFGVAAYVLDADSIRAGMSLCHRAVELFARCTESAAWPSYPATVEPITAPGWALAQGEF